jgi:hypothetical protein
VSTVQGPTHLRPGYELGVTSNKKDYYIFNHLVFNVLIHKSHGEYTRAQNSAFTSSIAVDTSGRRMLSWPKNTPQQVLVALSVPVSPAHACPYQHILHCLVCTWWSCAVLERSAEVCVQVVDALKARSARHLTKQESQLSKDDKEVQKVLRKKASEHAKEEHVRSPYLVHPLLAPAGLLAHLQWQHPALQQLHSM